MFLSFTCKMQVIKLTLPHSSGGETGRHVRLRGVCRKTCEFESRPEHKNKKPLKVLPFKGFWIFYPICRIDGVRAGSKVIWII